MGLLDIFKKKTKNEIYCKFDFTKAPELLETYREYKSLRLKATELSMKDTKNNKYENVATARDEFGRNVFAKKIWDREIEEFQLSNYALTKLKSCGIHKVGDLYATNPKQEPGWYAVRELFGKLPSCR